MAASRKRSRSGKAKHGTHGWLWMLFGLSIGLVVAAAIYFSDQRAPVPATATAIPPQAEPATPARPAPRAEPTATEPRTTTQFDFYDMLPQFEVVIPESEQSVRPTRKAAAVEEAGNYVLQAGSFTALADADRMKASLALLGIESRIQRVQIDDDTFHRVRIGPIGNLDELNQIRRRLWDANIDVMLLRVTK
jgi:cell division protein FtsN